MEERVLEGIIKGAKEIVPLDQTELKEKTKCICKINGFVIGTGFFCKIPYEDIFIPALITNYHVINDKFIQDNDQLKIYINDDSKIININKNRILYSSIKDEYDIMVIKLKEEDEIDNYLQIDHNIFINNSENSYKNEPIYILQYPNAKNASVSYGEGIEQENKYYIKHFCNTMTGSSGGPILSSLTDKVIGIHKGCIKIKGMNKYNIGTFLKNPLNELIKNLESNENKFNEIRMEIKIVKEDINKDIYFLDNTEEHNHLKEINENNTELYINNKKIEYKKYFRPAEEGIHKILLKFNFLIKDCSYMFYNSDKLQNIIFSFFNTRKVTNMSNMFAGCKDLDSISGISEWNTKNVNNMSRMFSTCSSLQSLPDISKWNTINVIDVSFMFCECTSLQSLPDISKWNTINCTNMSFMFGGCSSLLSMPDISKWNTTNVKDMSRMFSTCYSLISIPDISKWNTRNVNKMSRIFSSCSSLQSIPDISKWDITNVKDLNDIENMFFLCNPSLLIPENLKKMKK